MASPALPLPLRTRLPDGTGDRPLGVLITRPEDQAVDTADWVHTAGGQAIVCPCLRQMPPADPAALLNAVEGLAGFAAVALTSSHAVEALADALRALAKPAPIALRDVMVGVVGPRTADALTTLGRPPDLIAGSDSDGGGSSAGQLARLLIAQHAQAKNPRPPHALFLRAADARPALPITLRGAGWQVTEVEAYRMQAATPQQLAPLYDALAAARVDLVPFGSPRTVEIALDALAHHAGSPAAARALLARVRVGAIGETTAQALARQGIRVDVTAATATFPALLQALAAAAPPT